MKILLDKNNNQSVYLMEDSEVVVIDDQRVSIGNPVHIIFSDLNADNVLLVENVTPPKDWFGRKYLYANGSWTLNPDWVSSALTV